MLFFVRVSWQFPARWSNCRQPFSLIMSLTPAPNCCFYYFAEGKEHVTSLLPLLTVGLTTLSGMQRSEPEGESGGTETLPYFIISPIFIAMFHHSMYSSCYFVCISHANIGASVVTYHTQSHASLKGCLLQWPDRLVLNYN